MNRRRFLKQAFLASIGGGLVNSSCTRDPASAGSVSPRFFTTTRRNGRWWFLTPAGEMFWSIGLNHIDPATLRYLDSGEVWAEKYGNSMERWLAAVQQDLSAWGFNIGYFFADCPTWVHQSDATAWKAPLFDPGMLQTAAGKRELSGLAGTYYRAITESIRRYDPHHLIMGDRYEANRPLPEEVVAAALPFVDVLAFQCFGDAATVGERLGRWTAFADKPVLLADNAPWLGSAPGGWPPQTDRHVDPAEYRNILHTLRQNPHCVGYHLCGAYLRNKVRRYGLKDARDGEDPSTSGLQAANEEMHRWIRQQTEPLGQPAVPQRQ